MNFKELKELVGSRPFVWVDYGGNEYITQIDDNFVYYHEGQMGYGHCIGIRYPDSEEMNGMKQVTDHFEEKSQSILVSIAVSADCSGSGGDNGAPRKCTCEWVSVLRIGCTCGAIERYNPSKVWSYEE